MDIHYTGHYRQTCTVITQGLIEYKYYLGDSNKIILIRVSEKPLKGTEDSSDRISTPLLGIESLHIYSTQL